MSDKAKTRAQLKREDTAARKAAERVMAYIPLPDEFLDAMGEEWRLSTPDGIGEGMDLREVLKVTARRIPVKDAGDADRSLDVLTGLKDETSEGYIVLPWNDWEWLKTRFKEMAHTIWAGPDSAYLRRYLDEVVTKTPPEPESADVDQAA